MQISLKELKELTKQYHLVSPHYDERFVPPVYISRKICVYFSYCFLRLGISANTVTLITHCLTMIGSLSFILGQPIYGGTAFFFGQLLDCSDGDVARVNGPSDKGHVLDSFGADLFYAFSMPSIGIFLYYYQKEESLFLANEYFVYVGIVSSLALLLARILKLNKINKKMQKKLSVDVDNEKSIPFSKKTNNIKKQSFVGFIFSKYRSNIFRNNFTAEPGMCFIIFSLSILRLNSYFAYYILFLMLYNIGYLLVELAMTLKWEN